MLQIVVVVSVIIHCLLLFYILGHGSLRLSPLSMYWLVSTLMFVVQPVVLFRASALQMFISDEIAIKGLLWGITGLTAFALPFIVYDRKCQSSSNQFRHVQWTRQMELYLCGVSLGVIGLCLWWIFIQQSGGVKEYYSVSHGQAGRWQDNTAYLYYSPHWIATGLVVAQVARSYGQKLNVPSWPMAVLWVGLSAHAILTGGRGPFAEVLLVAAGLQIYCKKKKVSLRQVITFMLVLSLGVLLLVGYRSFLHLGETDASLLPSVDVALLEIVNVSSSQQYYRTSGNEYLYSSSVIHAVDVTGKLLYGKDYLHSVTIHLIPRIIWPEKPYGWRDGAIDWNDILEIAGWQVQPGSAPGVVADLYLNWKWGALIALFVMGGMMNRIHLYGLSLSSPFAICYAVILLSLTPYWFAQDPRQGLMFTAYSIAPVVVIRHVLGRSVWSNG